MSIRFVWVVATVIVLIAGMFYLFMSRSGGEDVRQLAKSSVAAKANDNEKAASQKSKPNGGRRGAGRPVNVETAIASRLEITPTTQIPGSIISIADSRIASQTSGKLIWVANVGDAVEKGGVLAKIDPKDAQLAVNRIANDVSKLQSQYEYRNSVFKRYVALGKDSGVTETFIDELRSNKQVALADLKKARVQLSEAKENLTRTKILAPFTGRVVEQLAQMGEYAQTGSSVVRFVDTQNLEVTAQVPSTMVVPLSPGTFLKVEGPTGEKVAKFRALVPVGDSVSRTMEIRATLSDPTWLVGTPVRLTLQYSAPQSVVAVPRDSLVLRFEDIYVMRVNDGVAERVDVQLGESEGDMIAVVDSAIQPDDEVIIRGAERLRDGQNVLVKNNRSDAIGETAGAE